MIRLGLRLTTNGGREAVVRLAVSAVAVAFGVAMLLVALAGMNALHVQDARAAWLDTTSVSGEGGGADVSGSSSNDPGIRSSSAIDPLWFLVISDVFDNRQIIRVDVAATGPSSPRIPGIRQIPGAGQYDVSPALASLLRSTPAEELADRFPGRQAGTIANSALASPDSLVLVLGHSVAQLADYPGATQVTSIATKTDSGGAAGNNATTIEVILAIAICALLFPVLVFIGTATRLAAARREQRFAAMRLVGATIRQLAVISAVEASLAAVVGMVGGFLLFMGLHPMVQSFSLTGVTPFPGDVALTAADALVVALGVPSAAVVVALLALRRVVLSPLGVWRRTTPRIPSAFRILPLPAGVGVLLWRAHQARITNVGTQEIPFFVLGFLLIMIGLMLAGSWLTMAGSRLLAWRARRPGALLAGRRLSDDPRGAFRSVSGLVLTLFVTTVCVAVLTTLDTDVASGGRASGAVVDAFYDVTGAQSYGPVPSPSSAELVRLRALPGVLGVALVHNDPSAATFDNDINWGLGPTGFVSCAQVAAVPVLGRCRPGAQVAAVTPDYFNTGGVVRPTTVAAQAKTTWPSAPMTSAAVATTPVNAVVVNTDGSEAAVERARTALEDDFHYPTVPLTIGEVIPSTQQVVAEGQRLAAVVLLASLIIAGCSLAVSVVGGLSDRKRAFSLLRLAGVPMAALRRVMGIEGSLPLLAGAVVAVGIALLASDLSVRAVFGAAMEPPGVGYFIVVVIGIVGSLGVIVSTFPLLRRITGPEAARDD